MRRNKITRYVFIALAVLALLSQIEVYSCADPLIPQYLADACAASK